MSTLGDKDHAPTAGAAGGGGVKASRTGAAGTYASSVLGVACGPFSGGNAPDNYRGGGGGGASAAGSSANGGEGLASDITGVSLVYGSGGGGGGSKTQSDVLHPNGAGGTRASDGAYGTKVDSVVHYTAATAPAANSGAGGAGGFGGSIAADTIGAARYGSSGSDGIVVIRYDWTYNPNPPNAGFVISFK